MMKKMLGLVVFGLTAISAQAQLSLSNYTLGGIYNLPSVAPGGAATNLLANEASGVTYNWDRNTLFVVGDGGSSVVEVGLQGQLIGSMALSGFTNTSVGDPEGITYVGGGRFVVSFERVRNAAEFTYTAGTTISAADMRQVTLGTTVGNVGNEGISYDPLTNSAANGAGFVVVKETSPQGVFQTNINFNTLTATNGSASTANPVNLFNPASMGLVALSDVQALSTVQALAGTSSYADLLVLSYQSGQLIQVDRSGTVRSTLVLGSSVANAISYQHEGVTIDGSGNIYVVNEIGGGTNVPQLWVYTSTQPIPEPASAALMLAGLLAFAVRRPKRAKRAKRARQD